MLRCARSGVSRTRPLLRSRWASTAAQAQVTTNDEELSNVQPESALDLSTPPLAEHSIRKITGEQGVPARYEQNVVQSIIRQRMSRLPRTQLKSTSSIEAGILKRATTNPSYLTARKAVEEVLPHPAESRLDERAKKRNLYHPRHTDWLPFAKRLVDIKKRDDELSARSVEVSNTFLQDYTGSIRPNMWIQRVGSGSEVRVLSTYAEDSTDGNRLIMLQGSDRAVELAREDILALQKEYKLSSEQRIELKDVSAQNSDDYLSVHSVASFTRYVFRMTNESVPRLEERATGSPWHQVVANKLGKVFSSSETSMYASTVALNRALGFLAIRSELVGISDLLHSRAKQMGLQMDCTSYNLLIGPAIAANNVKKVDGLLSEMSLTNTVPNSHTWSLFFRVCRRPDDKAVVIRMMEAANVRLTSRAKAVMATSLIRNKFHWMADSAKEVDSMVELLDQTFGPEWLNSQSYTFMLKMCTRRQLNLEVLPALNDLALKRSIALNSKAVIMTINATLRKSLDGALGRLYSLSNENAHMGLEEVISAIFVRAWQTRHVNVCRVLWRCAATHGSLTWDMRNAVNPALLRNEPGKEESNIQQARRLMARIVVGTDQQSPDFSGAFPRLSKQFQGQPDPILWLSEWTPDDGTRDEQLSLAYVLMHRDMHAYQKFAPMSRNLRNSLLRTAMLQDGVWIRNRWWKEESLEDLLDRAVKVPLWDKESFEFGEEINRNRTASGMKVLRRRGYRKFSVQTSHGERPKPRQQRRLRTQTPFAEVFQQSLRLREPKQSRKPTVLRARSSSNEKPTNGFRSGRHHRGEVDTYRTRPPRAAVGAAAEVYNDLVDRLMHPEVR